MAKAPQPSLVGGVYRRRLDESYVRLGAKRHADSLAGALASRGIGLRELWYPGVQNGALCGAMITGAILAVTESRDDRILLHGFDTLEAEWCGYDSVIRYTITAR